MSDDKANDIVSMVDVLEEDNALEEEAAAVLGACDDQNCTYSQGYVDRQALYSCLTCVPVDNASAGVCFACSLHCHDGHDLVELYTKRNFRCDCGNSKFKNFSCKLTVEKDESNERNSYNHNFQGKYCTCDRPYPDPEDEIEDEMIQCIACEDWYHSRHLGTLAPSEYQEMICDACMSKLDFLRWYKSLSVPSQEKLSGKILLKTRKEDPGDASKTKQEDAVVIKVNTKEASNDPCSTAEAGSSKAADTDNSFEASKCSPGDTSSCKLQSLKSGNENADTKSTLKATFWQNSWRKSLCCCDACKEMYKSKGIPFIIDQEDTVYEYEQRGKKRQAENSAYERGIRAFGTMDRINQVEVLTEYNDMKSELNDYLKSFAGEGKVVTKEDIEKFFEGMRARKRQKLEQRSGVQFFCK